MSMSVFTHCRLQGVSSEEEELGVMLNSGAVLQQRRCPTLNCPQDNAFNSDKQETCDTEAEALAKVMELK